VWTGGVWDGGLSTMKVGLQVDTSLFGSIGKIYDQHFGLSG